MRNSIHYLALALLLSATAVVYWHGLNGPFLFDDYTNIVDSNLEGLTYEDLADATFGNRSGVLRRPVSNFTFGLNNYLGGLTPFYYKLVNLSLHLMTGLFLFLFVRRILSQVTGQNLTSRAVFTSALLAAGIWLTHPLQVSTVLYIVQRMTQLSALFIIAGLLTYLRWRMRAPASLRIHLAYFASIIIFGTLAVLSKENGVLILPMVLLLEVSLFRFRPQGGESRTPLIAFHAFVIALPLFGGFVYFLTHINDLLSGYAGRPFDLYERLLTEVHAIWHYLKMIFLPDLREMGLYYDNFPITRSLTPSTALGIVGIMALLATAAITVRKHPVLSLGIGWFFAAHLLESTILPLEPAFEHRNYLALAGPCLILGYYTGGGIARAAPRRALLLTAGIGFAVTLAFLTTIRVDTWSTAEKFFVAQKLHNPQSERLHISIASYAIRRGDYKAAKAEIARLQQIDPGNPAAPMLRMFIECHLVSIRKENIQDAESALRTASRPDRALATMKVLSDLVLAGNCPQFPNHRLLGLIDAALGNPSVAYNPYHISRYWLLRGRVLHSLGKFDAAIEHFEYSYSIDEHDHQALFDIAWLQLNRGRLDATAETIERIDKKLKAEIFPDRAKGLSELREALNDAKALKTR